jgi:hypothetical protein
MFELILFREQAVKVAIKQRRILEMRVANTEWKESRGTVAQNREL